MSRLENHWKIAGALCLMPFLLSACGQDAPHYDDLPLRDALRAAPEVVANMSFETRRELVMKLGAPAAYLLSLRRRPL